MISLNKGEDMSQISCRYLNPKAEKQIFNIFIDSFSSLGSPEKTQDFLYDLLSPVEQLMLGKRLAIAYMLLKNHSQRIICNTLKVSQTTVARVNASLKSGIGYRTIITHMLKKEAVVTFFNQLEEKLDKILPPRGANWSDHYKRTATESVKNKKSF